VRLLDAIRKAVDPRGPLGEVLSPSEVFKERLGLPIAAPHTARAVLAASKEQVEHALAAPRFASLDESAPPNRVRQVSAYVEEHWSPVYAKTDSTDLATILVTSQQQIGWTVTQRESEQSRLARRAQQNAEEFAEVLQSMQIQASDEFYNGILETVPGNDPIILDGEILRGEATYDENGKMTHDGIIRGTMITKGRREYNERTKGYVHWDKGAWEQHLKAEAEWCSRPVRNVRRALEDCNNALPLWRPVGINFRRDRRSAV
jgi:hypothetical protein